MLCTISWHFNLCFDWRSKVTTLLHNITLLNVLNSTIMYIAVKAHRDLIMKTIATRLFVKPAGWKLIVISILYFDCRLIIPYHITYLKQKLLFFISSFGMRHAYCLNVTNHNKMFFTPHEVHEFCTRKLRIKVWILRNNRARDLSLLSY